MDRDSREEFEKRTREKALTDSERRAKDEERRSGEGSAIGGGAPANPMARLASDIADIKNVLTKTDGIHDRLPIRVLAA
jgi:hypothetical protein